MTEVVLGLGSNRNFNGLSPVELLSKACTMLEDFLEDIHFSSVYKTGALYKTDQDDFYNMVVLGKYAGTAWQLLDDIHRVENCYGRDRSKEVRNGPRPLDVDIELFGDQTFNDPRLTIPHPRIKERAFVLNPLLELFEKNADEKIKQSFPVTASHGQKLEACLDKVKDQKISLVLHSEEFAELVK